MFPKKKMNFLNHFWTFWTEKVTNECFLGLFPQLGVISQICGFERLSDAKACLQRRLNA